MKASRSVLGLGVSFLLLALLALPLASAEFGDHLYLDAGGGWKLGYEDETEQAFILEFVRPGETADNWSELLTVRGGFTLNPFPATTLPVPSNWRTRADQSES